MDPIELYHRWIDVWNDSADPAEILTEDFVGHWPDHDAAGVEGLRGDLEQLRSVFERIDFRIEVGPFSDGTFVAARWSGTGLNGAIQSRFAGNDILQVRDGRIAEYWVATVQLP